jgi:hypothetical protein
LNVDLPPFITFVSIKFIKNSSYTATVTKDSILNSIPMGAPLN